jgi:hypothetical protein
MLRKLRKSRIIPFIIPLLLIVNQVVGPYNISPNQEFEYDVKKAEVSLNIDGNSYLGKGFKINDVKFNQRTTILASVDSLGTDNVLWTLTSGDESISQLADWDLVDESTLSKNILNPFNIIQNFLINPTLVGDGLGLIFYPFLGTNRTIEFFKELKNQTHYQYTFFIQKLDEVQFEAYFDESKELNLFESLIIGRLNQESISPTFNMSFLHQSQLVYDTTIGLLYGSKFLSEGSGIFMNKTATYSFESHIELKNYNLPRSNLIVKNKAQIWWVFGISGSSLIIVIILFFTRKK